MGRRSAQVVAQDHLDDIDFVCEQRGEGLEQLGTRSGHRDAPQRQAYPQTGVFAYPQRSRSGGPYRIHALDQLRVGKQHRRVRPVAQVHAVTAGESAVDLLGDHRQQRGRHGHEDPQHRVEGVKRLPVAA